MNEFWKDIPVNWGFYQISNLGNIRPLRGKKIMLLRQTKKGNVVKLFNPRINKYKTFLVKELWEMLK